MQADHSTVHRGPQKMKTECTWAHSSKATVPRRIQLSLRTSMGAWVSSQNWLGSEALRQEEERRGVLAQFVISVLQAASAAEKVQKETRGGPCIFQIKHQLSGISSLLSPHHHQHPGSNYSVIGPSTWAPRPFTPPYPSPSTSCVTNSRACIKHLLNALATMRSTDIFLRWKSFWLGDQKT